MIVTQGKTRVRMAKATGLKEVPQTPCKGG
jgi:hypothetical protein